MALPKTETFTQSDGTQVSAIAGWSTQGNDLDVYSNSAAPDSSGNEVADYWDGDGAFNNDQYSTGTVVAAGASVFVGVAVRHSNSAVTYYGFYVDNNEQYLFENIGGAWNEIGTTGSDTISASDVLYLEASSTFITAKINGTSKCGSPIDDNSIASGYGGVCGFNDSPGTRIDNVEMGNLAAESASISPSSSQSPSASESRSVSPSASQSPSASESRSVSPSASESRSLSPSASESASESASPSPVVGLDVVWGHDTGVTQGNVRNFQGDWTGTGAIENPGVNDTERLALESGEYMIGPIVDTGASTVRVTLNSYVAGDAVTVEYRTAGTPNACAVAAWVPYAAPFASNGYSQVRLTSTL